MERSLSSESWSTPIFETRVAVVTTGNPSTSKKSVLSRCALRLRLPSANRRGIDRRLEFGFCGIGAFSLQCARNVGKLALYIRGHPVLDLELGVYHFFFGKI